MTYSPEDIALMTPQERRDALDAAATAYFGTPRWKSTFSRAVMLERVTIQQWFSDRSTPPTWAILIVQAWQKEREASTALESIKQVMRPILNSGD